MTRSLRIGSKVSDLITLAKDLSTSDPGLLTECSYDLLDVSAATDSFLSSVSYLNNDGVPLQLCLTSSTQGSGLRLIGDPGCIHDSIEQRFLSSKDTLLRILHRSGASELIPVATTSISTLLPRTEEGRKEYRNGFVWIAAGPDQPGVAFYLELSPLGVAGGWDAVDTWLLQLLPSVSKVQEILPLLRKYCVAASAGLEGNSLRNARAKIYFRLREAMSLNDLGIELFASPLMQEYLSVAMENDGVDLDGLVMSIGFSLSNGSLVDAKIDLCGHCLNHSIEEWSSIMKRLTDRFSLPAFDLSALRTHADMEIAFVGMGLTTDRKPRLNVYIKHAAASGAVTSDELHRSANDAIAYFLSTQRADGSWLDYHLPVGSSDQWVTAYTALSLAQAAKVFSNKEALAAAEHAAEWLRTDRPYRAGWGYNGMTGPDSDSTAIAIALFDELGWEVADEDRRFLRDHWKENLGVATYEGPEAWGTVHWDVTPLAYLGMDVADRILLRSSFETALRVHQLPSGFWRSYWWRNPYYSTLITLEALEQLGMDEPELTIDEPSSPLRIDNPFDLGCYIGIEWLRDPSDERIAGHLRSLLNWQERNGSWSGTSNLRVTENTCYEPWVEPQGKYYTDERSSLTTGTILRVLSKIATIRPIETQALYRPISLNGHH